MLSHHLIREARRRARLTQSELAMRAGTTQSAVARWEAGRSLPSLEKLQELVECCGLELGVSLGERRDAEERLLDQLRALTPEQRLQRLLAAIPFAGGEVAADATGAADEDERFEPVALLATLRRHEVRYVLIGGAGGHAVRIADPHRRRGYRAGGWRGEPGATGGGAARTRGDGARWW
jgi:transcriptional regulator with XRE-family HTH domain